MWDSLPFDILPLVLIRLPVKSIITCTSVYKTWKSVVQKPTCVYNHLLYSNNNNNHDLNEQTRFDFPFNNETFRVLVTFSVTPGTKPLIHDPTHQNRVSGNPRELLVGIELKLAESTTHLMPTFMIPEEFLFRVVGTCNGLGCVAIKFNEVFVLWNPCVRMFMNLPNPNVLPQTHGFYNSSSGFGFDAKTNDFKVVRFLTLGDRGENNSILTLVEVYSLATGQWEMVTSLPPTGGVRICDTMAFVNGAVHC